MRRTSPGLSSISRILSGDAVVTFLLRWQLDDGEPEALDRADHGEELVNAEWLGHVTVGMEGITPDYVLFGRGRCEDDDRDALKQLVLLDLTQQFAPVSLGQVEIEDNEVGAWPPSVLAFATQEG